MYESDINIVPVFSDADQTKFHEIVASIMADDIMNHFLLMPGYFIKPEGHTSGGCDGASFIIQARVYGPKQKMVRKGNSAVVPFDNVGFVDIAVRRDAVLGVLTVALLKDFRKKGIMTTALPMILNQCFLQQGLQKIEADVREGNEGSLKICTKFLVKEGIRRRNTQGPIPGKWLDNHLFGITREEFFGKFPRFTAEYREEDDK